MTFKIALNPSHPFCLALLLPGILLLNSSCSTTLAKIDQKALRARMIEYSEDQIMDNLVRAHKRLPIVHFDMKQMDALVKTSLSANIGAGQTLQHTDQSVATQAGGVITSIVGTAINYAQRPFTFSTTPGRDNTITVGVIPVLDKNEVYEAYEYFVSLPDSIRCSPRPKVAPGEEDPHHFGRVWDDGKYYWVPTEYREEFFKLSLRVTVKRGAVVGAENPLQTKPAAPGQKSSSARRKTNPLDAPPVTNSRDEKSPGVKALEDTTDELRRLRLLQ